MELKYSKSTSGKKNLYKEHVIGIPITSIYTPKLAISHDSAAQYQLMPSPSINNYSEIRHSKGDSVIAKMIKLGQNVDIFAQGLREHVRLGPKLSETVKGKLSLGARILQIGGLDKVFKKNFNTKEDEKLLKALQCYLSTTAGPIAGLLFISNHRIAFCSDRSIKISSATGKLQKLHYKVMIPLRKIKRVNESENVKRPTQKYVQLVTEDNFDFWFMGFLNHQKTLKYLQQAIHQARWDRPCVN